MTLIDLDRAREDKEPKLPEGADLERAIWDNAFGEFADLTGIILMYPVRQRILKAEGQPPQSLMDFMKALEFLPKFFAEIPLIEGVDAENLHFNPRLITQFDLLIVRLRDLIQQKGVTLAKLQKIHDMALDLQSKGAKQLLEKAS